MQRNYFVIIWNCLWTSKRNVIFCIGFNDLFLFVSPVFVCCFGSEEHLKSCTQWSRTRQHCSTIIKSLYLHLCTSIDRKSLVFYALNGLYRLTHYYIYNLNFSRIHTLPTYTHNICIYSRLNKHCEKRTPYYNTVCLFLFKKPLFRVVFHFNCCTAAERYSKIS